MELETMKLWNSVKKTDPKHVKKVTFGRKFSAIDAYSQIQKATELWGPFGSKWGTRDETFIPLGIHPDAFILYKGTFFYPEGEFPIASAIAYMPETKNGRKMDDDCIKKVRTDALTKGFSMLGFSADVFLGLFDDNKYVQEVNKQFAGTSMGKMSDNQLDQYKRLYGFFVAKYGDEDSAKQALREELNVEDLRNVGFSVFDMKWKEYEIQVLEFEGATGGTP